MGSLLTPRGSSGGSRRGEAMEKERGWGGSGAKGRTERDLGRIRWSESPVVRTPQRSGGDVKEADLGDDEGEIEGLL